MLECAFPKGLRSITAALWATGAAIAGFTAPLAFYRTGVISSLPFLVVTTSLILLAIGTLRGARVALIVSIVLLGAQIFGVVGSALELAAGGVTAKSEQLESLGLDPTLGLYLNLVYSAAAAALFLSVAIAWRRCMRSRAGD